MSTEENFDLTTDAVPNLRTEASAKEKTREESGEEIKDYDEEVNTNNVGRNPFRGFAKFKKSRVPTAQATIINISNSNGIHVGDQYVYNVKDRSEKTAKKIRETDSIKGLKTSQVSLDRETLLFVAKHMNESWKDTIRKLDYSDGQIDQFVIDNQHLGTKEIIFQILLDWSQNEPEKATFGNLSIVLWNHDQQDVVKRMSEIKTWRDSSVNSS